MGIQAGISLLHLLTDPLSRELPGFLLELLHYLGPDVSDLNLCPLSTLRGLNIVEHIVTCRGVCVTNNGSWIG